MKRGSRLVSIFVLTLLLSTAILAQDNTADALYDDIGDVSFNADAGITPDSPFYFLDTFFASLATSPESYLEEREEIIAELKDAVERGDTEAARKALERAEEYSRLLEKEVSPELEKKAREGSKAIKEVLDGLEDDVDEELKEDFKALERQQDDVAVAAKVSSKIEELCKTLSSLDPLEYHRVCKTDDNAPRWHQDLDQDLTDEQIREAQAFFSIMSQCFQTKGRTCRCEDITVNAFSKECSIIAPLAAACSDGDENACDTLDEREEKEDIFELLPPHLQAVMDKIDERYQEDEFDHHTPKECREQEATTREDCMKVMFYQKAPQPCINAYENGELDLSKERKAREQCERIMFQHNAPQECIDAELEDHKECGKLMWDLDAPDLCKQAGLTGEGRRDWATCETLRWNNEAPQVCLDANLEPGDWKKCDKLRWNDEAPQECLDAGLDSNNWKECDKLQFTLNAPQECLDAGINHFRACDQYMKEQGPGPDDSHRPGPGRNGAHCRTLDDPTERLTCYDDALTGIGSEHRTKGSDHRDCSPGERRRSRDGQTWCEPEIHCGDGEHRECDDDERCWCESNDKTELEHHDDEAEDDTTTPEYDAPDEPDTLDAPKHDQSDELETPEYDKPDQADELDTPERNQVDEPDEPTGRDEAEDDEDDSPNDVTGEFTNDFLHYYYR